MSAEPVFDFDGLTEQDLAGLDVETLTKWIVALEQLPGAPSGVTSEFARETCQEFIVDILGEQPSPAAIRHGITNPWTPDQARIMDSARTVKRTAVYSGNGVGKALALDTQILTPAGWTTMGALRIGDTVFDENGQPTQVTYISPIYTDHDCFEVTFSDGTRITADAEHEWVTWDHAARKSAGRRLRERKRAPSAHRWKNPKKRTTREIAETLQRKNGSGRRLNHSIPTCGAVQQPEAALPLSPYVLGCWLGDGHSAAPYLTVSDSDVELLGHVQAEGVTTRPMKSYNDRTQTYALGGKRDVRLKLRAVGVLGNKHIPESYLRASAKQRLALLQGLMDTDGYAGAAVNGYAEFCSTSRALADGALELIVSLGMIATMKESAAMLHGREVSRRWRITFKPSMPVFRLKRKLALFNPEAPQWNRRSHRYIVDVRRVPTVPVKCIQVDAPSHLYLASRSCIPTHNTYINGRLALWFLYGLKDTIVITTAPTVRQVENLLWGEIRSARARSKTPLPGRPLLTSVHLGEQWYAMGYTARIRTGDESATAFQGVHSRGRVVVIVDEATDIPEPLWSAIKRITIGVRDRIIAIGNPTDPSCYFARVAELKRPDGTPMWNTIICSGEEHPNVKFDDPEIVPGAVTTEFVQDTLHESGSRDSAVYRSSVLGLFPTDRPDGLISLEWITRSQARFERILEGTEPKPTARRGIALAADIAGEGNDLTILSAIEDHEWRIPELEPNEHRKHKRAWLQGRDVMVVADMIAQACHELKHVRIVVLDDTGVGQGVSARLRQLQREGKLPKYRQLDGKLRDIWIVRKNFGASSESALFHLVKDELWWGGREILRAGDLILPSEQVMTQWGLPRGNSLRSQLTTAIYGRTGDGEGNKIQVYDKRGAHGKAELTRNLPSKSPDIAHSYIMAVYGWNKLKADPDGRPAPRNMIEMFEEQVRASIDKATDSEKRKRHAGQKRTGPISPWARGKK